MFNILNCALALGLTTYIAVYPSSQEKQIIVEANNTVDFTNLDVYNSLGFSLTYLYSNTNFLKDYHLSNFIDVDSYLDNYDSSINAALNNECVLFTLGSSSAVEDTILIVTTSELDDQLSINDSGVFDGLYFYVNQMLPYNYDQLFFLCNLKLYQSYHYQSGIVYADNEAVLYSSLAYSKRLSYGFSYQNVFFSKYTFDFNTRYPSYFSNPWYSLETPQVPYGVHYNWLSFDFEFSNGDDLTGYTTGYYQGYYDGKQQGYNEGLQAGATANGLFFTIADTPILMLKSLFNFEFFGVNFFVIIAGLLTILLVLFVIKKFK